MELFIFMCGLVVGILGVSFFIMLITKANARLIAAAPQMYEVLEELVNVISIFADGDVVVLDVILKRTVFDKAKAALEAAGGSDE